MKLNKLKHSVEQAFPIWVVSLTSWAAIGGSPRHPCNVTVTAPDLTAFQQPQPLSPCILSRAPVSAHARCAGSSRTFGLLFELSCGGEKQLWALSKGSTFQCSSSACLFGAGEPVSASMVHGHDESRGMSAVGMILETSSTFPDHFLQVHCANLVVSGGLWGLGCSSSSPRAPQQLTRARPRCLAPGVLSTGEVPRRSGQDSPRAVHPSVSAAQFHWGTEIEAHPGLAPHLCSSPAPMKPQQELFSPRTAHILPAQRPLPKCCFALVPRQDGSLTPAPLCPAWTACLEKTGMQGRPWGQQAHIMAAAAGFQPTRRPFRRPLSPFSHSFLGFSLLFTSQCQKAPAFCMSLLAGHGVRHWGRPGGEQFCCEEW